jgi:hypothetical protein
LRHLFATLLLFSLASSAFAQARPLRPPAESEPSGFRMATDPKIITVFGDTAAYRGYVDRFHALFGDMQTTREQFSREVQGVLQTLTAHAEIQQGKRKCPADAVALSYSRAFHLGEQYHQLGKELEAHYSSIKELDGLGETSGLTPDYRWKVARALKLYPQVLRDFREMRVAFQDQLAGELGFSGCDVTQLVAKGDEMERSGTAPPPLPEKKVEAPKKGRKVEEPILPVAATTVTFFVDNATCGGSLRVFVDGTLVGEVGGNAKAAFRAMSGRHEMCLIPASAKQSCGDPGTVRKAYVHDGWAVTLRCD